MRHFKNYMAVLLISALFFCVLLTSFPRFETHSASSLSASCTTSEEIHSAFPESYWADLDALIAAHPSWSFTAFYTGVTFDETLGTGAEMKPGRNLIEYIAEKTSQWYHPTSWYSTESGYNWAGNSWTVLSSPNWVQASEAAVRYCMDPRNYLTEQQIYQFLDHLSAASLPVVQYLFSEGGSFWTQSGEEADLYYEIEVPAETGESSVSGNGNESETAGAETETQKVYLTYAEALLKIGEEVGMSAAVLAARVLQEQGTGSSPLISGTQEFTVTETIEGQTVTKTVSGYYNYFNIDATDGGTADQETIYQNGLTEAYNAGWDTRYKALLGGAEKLYKNYVAHGQYTFYSQKFNVDSSSSRQYWGQYMQNILAPSSEADKTYAAYSGSGELDSSQNFIIPVFTDIPAEKAPYPTKDGNPNYKLSYIYINDSSLEGFDTDTLSYAMTVDPDVSSLSLLVKAYADTTAIAVGSSSALSQLSAVLNLVCGENIFTILCTAENGDTRTYTLTVTRENANLYGDVNGDNAWDIYDVTYMQSHVLKYTALEGDSLDAADVNGDGAVDIYDITYIMSYILHYSDTVPQRAAGQALNTSE